MNWNDIDFSTIRQMMDSMSDEEKASFNDMANNMMNSMRKESEEELNIYDFLHIQEEDYADLAVLDLIESAVELEDFYDGDPAADYSASVLFYAKSILKLLRAQHFPIYKNVLNNADFKNPESTTIHSYLMPLMRDETIRTLIDEQFGTSEAWLAHKDLLQQIYILLNRAEYDTVSYEELQALKTALFTQKGMLRINHLV